MTAFIGIDGGGTTTRVFIQRDDREPEYFEFPISLKIRNGDYARSATKLRDILCRDLAVSAQDLALSIGLSGMSREEDQELLRSAIVTLPEFSEARVHIESDATLTLKSVLAEGAEGILLIAGTGSVIFYQPSGGSARRIGGWGPLLSDEGSGYRIGLRALRHYVNVLDGVYPRDALCELMNTRMIGHAPRMGITDTPVSPRDLTKRAESDSAFVASFAQDALEAAMNDPDHSNRKHIQDLVYEELIDLTTLVFPLTLPGVMSGSKPYNLYLAGGVARHSVTTRLMEDAYDDDNYFALHLVDDRAPAFKALEIARAMMNRDSGASWNGTVSSLV
jgi:hypothetical protein